MEKKYSSILILGSGPAGYTAAIYGARSSRKTTVISGPLLGGQLTQTSEIENYPGFPEKITGIELMDRMREQAENMGAEIVEDTAVSVDFKKNEVVLDGGDIYNYDVLIIATGAMSKWLGLPNEENLKGMGVSVCATCDGFFYRNKIVVVVGGGNSAVEEALYLANLAQKVYLVHRRDKLKAEVELQKRLLEHPKIETKWNKVSIAYEGNQTTGVTGLTVEDIISHKQETIACDGVFIAIGHKPNTELFVQQLDLDESGLIKPMQTGTALTRYDNVFVAGDVQELTCCQAITAAAGGCRAAMTALTYLDKKQ
ncbi:MAG: FAD-dependent oxidoreductase [Alphaproteobacteria bacterium]|nr:FAD-dependent oxidoreductase [Alphaproteobacteria bacterium]